MIFRDDNTDGYTTAQLARANALYAERYPGLDPDSDEGKAAQERILLEVETDAREAVAAL